MRVLESFQSFAPAGSSDGFSFGVKTSQNKKWLLLTARNPELIHQTVFFVNDLFSLCERHFEELLDDGGTETVR